jgi:hypothetical protein
MALYKLHIEDFDEVDYELIAIHTSLEDYRLAYFLNQKLPILLQKNKLQIALKEGENYFSRYHFEDEKNDIHWHLIQNKNEVTVEKKETAQNLFTNTKLAVSTQVYLLPEFKKVDYFLKIENTEPEITEIVNRIHAIDRITAAYAIANKQIKSKNNLIF